MKNKITAILLLMCLGCRYSNKNITTSALQEDSFKKIYNKDTLKTDQNLALRVKKSDAVNLDYGKLTCDSLMILLIKSSSIDKRALKYRVGIDSIKSKIVYLSFSFIDHDNGSTRNGYFLQVDLNKKLMTGGPEEVSSLTFDSKIMNYLIDKKCYNSDADYVTAPQ
ncbi:hypothetical protein C8P68_102569 [Mucilaginibacter yixingensis]|uniref:Uncharacterized protein n=1 Tax=Mucilaginibacter yixingensis TaxID=1295612 RepID=A0A2T5JDA5_9SPHI|nr:hypothetical protein [Mucilaginibacter yixingensis]PTQ99739.1 hypothetical protein C8P68_102569 [Mucilaginibacter yixingensis]